LEHEKVKPEPTTQSSGANQDSSVSMENLPSFGKILITDDGTDEPNNVLKYAVSLSKYTGAELLILRVVKDMKKIEGISVQGSSMSNKHTTQEICKEAGCEKNISYKFRVGDAIEQIVSEVKDGNYDLLILRSTNLDSDEIRIQQRTKNN